MSETGSASSNRIDQLYSLACELLASDLMVYYVSDTVFREEARLRVMSWIHQADDLVNWLQEEKYRGEALQRVDYDYEEFTGSYIEEAISELSHAASRAVAGYPQIQQYMWFYFSYCRWFLYSLREFDKLMRSEPIVSSSNYQHYLNNLDKFTSFAQRLEKEYPDFTSYQVDSEARVLLEHIINATARHLSEVWLNRLFDMYRSIP